MSKFQTIIKALEMGMVVDLYNKLMYKLSGLHDDPILFSQYKNDDIDFWHPSKETFNYMFVQCEKIPDDYIKDLKADIVLNELKVKRNIESKCYKCKKFKPREFSYFTASVWFCEDCIEG